MIETSLNASPQLLAREFFNGLWVVMTFSIALLAAVRLAWEYRNWRSYRNFSDPASTFFEFRRRPVVRVGTAMVIYFMAECAQRLWIFILLRESLIHSDQRAWWEEFYILALGATAIAVVGGLCIIRVLAPAGWGRRAALAAVVMCAMFLSVALPPGFTDAAYRAAQIFFR